MMERQTLTTPVKVLAAVFVPDRKLGPDTGRKYALVEMNDCFYPLIFINQDMDSPDYLHLNGRPVLMLKPNEIPGSTEDVNENGHAYWTNRDEAMKKFYEHYTEQVYGYLVDVSE